MGKRKADQMVVGDEEKKKEVASNENERSETSFDDLPYDILIKIFALSDLPTRLKLRLNKRLAKIHRSIKMNFKLLEVKITRDQYVLTLDTSDVCYRREFDDFTLLENTLRGLVNTSVNRLRIDADLVPSEKFACVINLFSSFDADQLSVGGWRFDPVRVPQITLSTLLTLAENVRDIELRITCDSVSAQELCTLRKLFSDCVLGSSLSHFESELLTDIRLIEIAFRKGGVKPEEKKVKMNHLYVYGLEDSSSSSDDESSSSEDE